MTHAGPAPALSVIAPLIDNRGHAVEAVSSWTRGQTLARDQYEVLVVSNGREGDAEAAAQRYLGPGDRLLRREHVNELALDDHGARQARGRWLLFTEGHCVPEPTCLEALLEHLETRWPTEAGACLRTTDDGNPHPLAALEGRAYQEGFAEWSRDGDWRKVTIRGIAVRRQVYLDVGGFEHEFGCFAEAALAATLHARGYRLGYVPAAAVKHYNSTNLRELLAYVQEYRDGEARYRAGVPAAHFEAYFGGEPEMAAPTGVDRWWAVHAAARSLAAAVARPRVEGALDMARTAFRVLPGLVGSTLLGDAGDRLAARVTYLRARFSFAIPGQHPDERYRRYLRLWEAAGRVARAGAVRPRALLVTEPVKEADPRAGFVLRPGELGPDRLIGFHARETWEGRAFRWAAPLAMLAVQVPPEPYRVILDTRGLRGRDIRGLVDLYLNGHRAPVAPAGYDPLAPGELAFTVDRRMFRPAPPQRLTLVSRRLRAAGSRDPRALGLPLFAITFRPEPTAVQRRPAARGVAATPPPRGSVTAP